MPKWTDMGHAMRRRIGAPSNHLESANAGDSRVHATLDEHYAVAADADSVRIPVGREDKEEGHNVISDVQDADDYTGAAAKPVKGTPVAKGNVQAGDPTAGGKANRANVAYGGERMGAAYQVTEATSMTVDPTVGPTMANAKVVPSVQGRQNPNFQNAISDLY